MLITVGSWCRSNEAFGVIFRKHGSRYASYPNSPSHSPAGNFHHEIQGPVYSMFTYVYSMTPVFNDVKVTVNFSWFLHPSCFVKQAWVLLHVSLTQPRRPFAFFIQLANFHPSINRKTVMQTTFYLLLHAWWNVTLSLNPFLNPSFPPLPAGARCHGCAIASLLHVFILAFCHWTSIACFFHFIESSWRDETIVLCVLNSRYVPNTS